MSAADAEPHYVFGVQPRVANSLISLDEHNIIFPFGNNCVFFNVEQKCQHFIPATKNSRGMLALAISSNRRYLAVSERGERGTITVYDLPERYRKRYVLSVEDVPVQEFVSVAFSHDCEYIIGQSGPPEWILFCWTLKTMTVIGTVKTGAVANPIYQVSFNPEDSTQICVCGNGVFKLFWRNVGEFKQTIIKKLVKMEAHNFLSHEWLSGSRLIVGTDIGQLMVFESGGLFLEMNLNPKPYTPDPEREKEKQEEAVATQFFRITVITAYSKGFACSAGPGLICLFERMKEGDGYRKSREIRIPKDTHSKDPSQAEKQEIVSLCISPGEENLCTCTDRGQLYSVNLIALEMDKKGEPVQFEYLTHALHWGTITSLSICILKPLIATSSQDLSVRIWNVQTSMLEIYKGFSEEPRCVAFHPTGLSVLVAFPENLSWLNLLIDDFRTFVEFRVKGCTECAFSNGGHMFAAISGTNIHLYSTTTFENVMDLSDHSAVVRSFVWSEDDSRLVSCSMDGVMYVWSMYSGELEYECSHKSCLYTNITIAPDSRTVFAVGTDCTLKEIQDSQIVTEVAATTGTFTTLAMSREGTVLFCGTSVGSVTVTKYPFLKTKKLFEFQGHAGPITKMVVTFDDKYLLTISEDGSLLIWRIVWNTYGLMRDKKMVSLEEIFITKSNLEDKNHNMLDLSARVQVLNIENQYQLRLRDMEHNRNFKKMTNKFTEEIESLEKKIEALIAEKEQMKLDHEALMGQVMQKHAKDLQDFDANMCRKLANEYEASHRMQVKSQQEIDEFKQKLHSTEENHNRVMEELIRGYETRLQDNFLQLQQCEKEAHQQQSEYELMIKMIEQDSDKEILDIRCKYETILKDEKEKGMHYKDETGIMKKKFSYLQKEIGLKNMEVEKCKSELQKHRNVISSLEKEILGLREEIEMRNENIAEKEINITEMRKRNCDLDKLRYILDHRVKELTMQIEPKEKTIKGMKEQIQKMEDELETFSNQNSCLERNVTELKLKLHAMDKDKHQALERAADMTTVVQRFKADLHSCIAFIQDPKELKDSIIKLHKCYIEKSDEDILRQDLGTLKDGRITDDVGKKVVISLRRKLAKSCETHSAEKFKWMQDDSTLIKELNDLRKELKVNQDKVADYENQLSVYRRKKSHSTELEGLNSLVAGPSSRVTTLSPEEESQRVVQMQHLEIARLRQQLLENTGRLPRRLSHGAEPPAPPPPPPPHEKPPFVL